MDQRPGMLPFDSQSGPARGLDGDGAPRLRWKAGAALALTLALALVLAVVVDDLLPESSARTTPVAPPESSSAGCSLTLDPTPDLAQLVNRLRPGDIACMTPGVYGDRGARTDWEVSGEPADPIELRALEPGTVQLRGFVNLNADHLVLDGLVFDGPTGFVTPDNLPSGEEVLVWAQGDDLVLRNCEVRDGLWRAGIYVSGRDVTVDSCWVHDIGPWFDPEQEQLGGKANNIDHGIYWGEGSAGLLVNSVIEHNLAYGVQLSSGARGVTVANNTIVRNGAGGVIWADDTSDSLLVNNILALNDGYAVTTFELTGANNVARNNLSWGNSEGEWNTTASLVTRLNGVADPMFASQRDYRLRAKSPAVDAADGASAPDQDIDGRQRPQGRAPDLGAYERPADVPAP